MERVGDGVVEVVEAVREARPERLRVETFVERCGAPVVEQPFLPRLADGMTHVYLTAGCSRR